MIHPSQTPPELEAFVCEAFDLEPVAADGDAVLYRPRSSVPSGPVGRATATETAQAASSDATGAGR